MIHRRQLSIIPWLVLGTLIVAIACATGWVARQHALDQLSTQAAEQLQIRALSLQRLIDRYKVLPTVLALDPELRSSLAGPTQAIDVALLNRKLEQANGATHASTLTLFDRHGVTVAASNWREPSSSVGRDLTFRPYFQRAMQQDHGAFYGIGVTTNVAGYFIAEALHDDRGQRVGVIVVKITLDTLQKEWTNNDDTLLLSDEHDIVFLSTRSAWNYRPLHALDPATSAAVAATRQYGDRLLPPAELQPIRPLAGGGQLARVRIVAEPLHEAVWQSKGLPAQHWTLHLLQSTQPATLATYHAVLITLGGWLPAILLGLFLKQRWHLARLRQRSREEIERLVSHYASALRSEQDSLVQAALQAGRGHSNVLQQMPQGVSVVDAQLRLVAWNTRYAEIFAYPDDLLRAGRPIEDLFRYNAQRGLLGPGDVEEAIQRRLDYLRRGSPHEYERARTDDSVLEIRGHPLPGGGFVTSYADITAYKDAARELRTLTHTLEQRIETNTRDLRVAKAEAERANRDKTRFIAAAVHDLLQPLNAARMFVGVLRGRLITTSEQELVAHIESTLTAQDELLASLLDISRLEAGALPVTMQDIELLPLLTELARQFGILAQARGLSLHWVANQSVLRTDPLLLRRILQNFLSNAIHYTPRGRVLLGCRRVGATLRIEVWDTGCGIPPARQQLIFEEFQRLDHARHPDDRSAGLGLSIVDRIARLLDHQIGLRSWPGRGSVFSVSVPLGDPTQVATTVAETPGNIDEDSPLQGVSVWCVDDDGQVREATRALLLHWGCQVTLADGAQQALALAGQVAAPALLLLDYQLGDSLGPDLLPALRELWRREPPVIVLSAQQDEQTRRQLDALGLHFLAKPVRPAALRALMTQLLLAAGSK